MNFIKSFIGTKKGKAMIGTAIGGIILYFFPEYADTFLEIMNATADKIQPETLGE